MINLIGIFLKLPRVKTFFVCVIQFPRGIKHEKRKANSLSNKPFYSQTVYFRTFNKINIKK